MKLAVVGSRDWTDETLLRQAILLMHMRGGVDLLISGGATGADKMAEQWARDKEIPRVTFLPNWGANGSSAGAIRNQDIVDHADIIMAFVVPVPCIECTERGKVRFSLYDLECLNCSGRGWLPTKGTAITLRMAVKANKPTCVITPDAKQHEWVLKT